MPFNIARVLKINNEEISFPRLNLYELKAMGEIIIAQREEEANKLVANDLSLDAYTKLNYKLELRSRKPLLTEIYQYCQSPEGAHRVIKLSLEKQKYSQENIDSILDQLNISQSTELSSMLVLDMQDVPQEKSKVKEPVESPLEVAPVTSTGEQSSTKPEEPKKPNPKKKVEFYGMHKLNEAAETK